jgi:hypothetical protein
MATDGDASGPLDRALAEVEGLRAVFGEESVEALSAPRASPSPTSLLSFSFTLPTEGGSASSSSSSSPSSLRLAVSLPRGYPETETPALAFISAASLPRAALTALTARLGADVAQHGREAPDAECLFWAVCRAQELVGDAVAGLRAGGGGSGGAEDATATTSTMSAAPGVSSRQTSITSAPDGPSSAIPTSHPPRKHVWLWFHHIASPRKKALMSEWATELDLAGLVKPGFPGAAWVTGRGCAGVDEWVRRVKSLQWQGIAVREELVVVAGVGQEEGEGEGSIFARLDGLHFLGEGDMGVLAKEMAALGPEFELRFRRGVLGLGG